MEQTAQPAQPSGQKKKKVAIAIFGGFWVIAALVGFFFLRYRSTHVSTDDAFIEGTVYTVASKIQGTVKEVHVSDNRQVKKGDLLLELESSDLEVKEAESRANLEVERARLAEAKSKTEAASRQLSELRYKVSATKANIEGLKASLRQAESDQKRAEKLSTEDAISKEKYEKTKTAFELAAAQLASAKKQSSQAEAAVLSQKAFVGQFEAAAKTSEATILLREANLKAADLNLGYSKLYAPEDGFVTKKSVQPGNQIQPGQPLMAIVPLEELWVVANYKETQLERIKPGLPVSVKIDAYPGMKFTGRVDSIMAGTGSAFSLFPPENATGNFVKVVQRVPVKIAFDKGSDPQRILRVGMSVVPTVLIEK